MTNSEIAAILKRSLQRVNAEITIIHGMFDELNGANIVRRQVRIRTDVLSALEHLADVSDRLASAHKEITQS